MAIAAPLRDSVGNVLVTTRFRKLGGPVGGGFGIIVGDDQPGSRDGRNQSGSFYVAEVGDLGQVGIWRREGTAWNVMPWTSQSSPPWTGHQRAFCSGLWEAIDPDG